MQQAVPLPGGAGRKRKALLLPAHATWVARNAGVALLF